MYNKNLRVAISIVVCFLLFFSTAACLHACESKNGGNGQDTTAAEQQTGDPSASGKEHDNDDILMPLERTTWNIELSVKEITDSGVVITIKDMDNKGFYSIFEYYNLEYLTDSGWKMITNHKDPAGVWDYGFTVPQKDMDYSVTHNIVNFTLLYDRDILIPGKYRAVQYFNDHMGSDGIHEFRVEFELTAEQIAKIKEAK